MSPKQKAILDHIKVNGRISKSQAVALVGGDIYHNADHYVGQTLGRMVKRGLIKREKVGVYIQGTGTPEQSPTRQTCEQIEEEPTPVYRCKYETTKGRPDRCLICPLKK